MHVVNQYPNGVFCWVDLATTDTAGAKAFYSALFGWDALERPIDMGGVYLMFQKDGKNVAGGGEMQPDMKEQGVPSFWTSYVKHDNADAIAAKISEAGGTLLFPPMDVMSEGRMVMAQDPTGAVFGVWQPINHTGAQLVNMPNTLVWNELMTPDLSAAREFYGAVFGWTGEPDANGYVTLAVDGRRQAGMMGMDETMQGIPPNWGIYFHVEDVDAAMEKVKELGGNVLMGPIPAGEIGRFAVVQDPQGAAFNVITFNGPPDPPPGA